MNKARRHELKMLKYKKRLKQISALNADSIKCPKGERYNYTAYRSHGKPCSCAMCSHGKYERAKEKKRVFDTAIKPHNETSADMIQDLGKYATTFYGYYLINKVA